MLHALENLLIGLISRTERKPAFSPPDSRLFTKSCQPDTLAFSSNCGFQFNGLRSPFGSRTLLRNRWQAVSAAKILKVWSRRRDSNPRRPAWESGTQLKIKTKCDHGYAF